VAPRDDHFKKTKEIHEALRFTTDEIVRAIEAVEQAGLTIYGVEVATNGSIKINTTSPFKKRGVVTTPETGGDAQDEIHSNKKRA